MKKITTVDKVRALDAKGASVADIADKLGVTRQYVYNVRSKLRKETETDVAAPNVAALQQEVGQLNIRLRQVGAELAAAKEDQQFWFAQVARYSTATLWKRIVYVFRGHL